MGSSLPPRPSLKRPATALVIPPKGDWIRTKAKQLRQGGGSYKRALERAESAYYRMLASKMGRRFKGLGGPTLKAENAYLAQMGLAQLLEPSARKAVHSG